MLRNLRLRPKIIGVCTIISLFSLAVGLIAMIATKNLRNTMDSLLAQDVPERVLAGELQAEMLLLRRFEKDFIINVGKADAQKKYLEEFNVALQTMQGDVRKLIDIAAVDSGVTKETLIGLKAIPDLLVAYNDEFSKVRKAMDNDPKMISGEANQLMAGAKKSIHEFEETLKKATKNFDSMMDDSLQDATRASQQAILRAMVVGVAATVVAVLLGLWLASAIAGPMARLKASFEFISKGILKGQRIEGITNDEIGEASQAANNLILMLQNVSDLLERVGNGDLRQHLSPQDPEDEISAGVNKMIDNLRTLILHSRRSSSMVNSSANQVSGASQSLSQGATEQAASTEEISSSINELLSRIKQNAEHATDASQLAVKARTCANVGQTQIETTVGAMSEINKASQHISKIIKVIDDIAFQTNLLALNAAVEAARAGVHGKGFAVVAEEVRNLAFRSATAAKETTELIEASGKKVENGLQEATRTAATFKEIADVVMKVADVVGQISQASTEQANAVQQVSLGINQISQATQQATANSEETASAAQELSSQAADLQHLLSRFELNDDIQDSKLVIKRAA